MRSVTRSWARCGASSVTRTLRSICSRPRARDIRGRHTIGPADFLRLRSGYTVADAATVFDQAFAREDIIECGCNMHARRYFVKALDGGEARAAIAIDAYQALYGIEKEARDLEPRERLRLRRERSAPIFNKLLEVGRVPQRRRGLLHCASVERSTISRTSKCR